MKETQKQSPLPSSEWCVISAVGETSKHKYWVEKPIEFDLHLIVFDNSYHNYKSDTLFIQQSEGYKFKLIYNYLQENDHFIDHYKYFYIPDDDIIIKTDDIHRLFKYMETYNLAIAQPALANEYYTFPHTLKRFNSKLRYTNFIEIMQPCFSRDALKKTLFTFNENESGWGIDFHWGELVNYKKRNMAIIDDVLSIHSKPVQSQHRDDLNSYLQKYDLNTDIHEEI